MGVPAIAQEAPYSSPLLYNANFPIFVSVKKEIKRCSEEKRQSS